MRRGGEPTGERPWARHRAEWPGCRGPGRAVLQVQGCRRRVDHLTGPTLRQRKPRDPSQDPGDNRRMPVASPERIRADVRALAHRGLGVGDLAVRAARILAEAVPFDGFCLLTMDPLTRVPTDEVVDNGL